MVKINTLNIRLIWVALVGFQEDKNLGQEDLHILGTCGLNLLYDKP